MLVSSLNDCNGRVWAWGKAGSLELRSFKSSSQSDVETGRVTPFKDEKLRYRKRKNKIPSLGAKLRVLGAVPLAYPLASSSNELACAGSFLDLVRVILWEFSQVSFFPLLVI